MKILKCHVRSESHSTPALVVTSPRHAPSKMELIQYHLTYVHFYSDFHFAFIPTHNALICGREKSEFFSFLFQFHKPVTQRCLSRSFFLGICVVSCCWWWWCMNIKKAFLSSLSAPSWKQFQIKNSTEMFLLCNSFVPLLTTWLMWCRRDSLRRVGRSL